LVGRYQESDCIVDLMGSLPRNFKMMKDLEVVADHDLGWLNLELLHLKTVTYFELVMKREKRENFIRITRAVVSGRELHTTNAAR